MTKESGLREKVIEILVRLGVSSLSEYIGNPKLERFHASGQPLDSYSLAEILYTEKGISIFKNKSLRLELLASFGPERLKYILETESSIWESLQKYNNFSFGNNIKTKEFLVLFDLNEINIFSPKSANQPIEEAPVVKPLHMYQNWIRKDINSFLNDESKKRVIVHMPTGSGKTRTMLEAVSDYIRSKKTTNISVVWLAHSEELCEQAVESFKFIWSKLGSEPAKIVRLWGGSRPELLQIESPTFVVTSFQTAYSMLSTSDDEYFLLFSIIRDHCALMVVDEAHQSTAPTYKSAIELFSNHSTKIIGLTATPGRHHIGKKNDATKELVNFYENNKINILDNEGNELLDPINYLTKQGILASINRYQLNSGSEIVLNSAEIRYMEKFLDIPKSVLEKLGKDAKRTNLIVTYAIKLAIEEQLPTLIFAPSKENAIEIATILQLKEVNAASITSDTLPFERRESINHFKEGHIPILVNFSVLTTGFDAPNIKAVIIARPTTSVVLYSQMIGRGLRGPSMGGEPECSLIDVKDNLINLPNADEAFTFFDEFYNKTGVIHDSDH